jgi:hypothetical protein
MPDIRQQRQAADDGHLRAKAQLLKEQEIAKKIGLRLPLFPRNEDFRRINRH